jgi:hypothetical protein
MLWRIGKGLNLIPMKMKQWIRNASMAFVLGMLIVPLKAQPLTTQALSMTGLHAEGNTFCNADWDLFNKRKKKKKHKAKTFAAGVVVGTPVGFGGRVIFRPSRLAVAGDIAYNRIRTDKGLLTNAMVLKLDARFYGKGLFAKLLRPYIFTGMTMQRGNFNESQVQSVYAVDAGVGGGVKLWRLEVNGEVGILIPVRGVETYKPSFGAFANVGVMWWLF